MRFHRTSHGVHFALTVVTLGLWLPVWVWRALDNRQRNSLQSATGRSVPASKAIDITLIVFLVVLSAITKSLDPLHPELSIVLGVLAAGLFVRLSVIIFREGFL